MTIKISKVKLRCLFFFAATVFLAVFFKHSGINANSNGSYSLTSSGNRQVMIMSYNVEHLMDPDDHPDHMDDYFTPLSPLGWDEEKLLEKARKIADAVLSVDSEGFYGTGPDIIVLQEIENRRVLEMLKMFLNQKIKKINPDSVLYREIVHYDTEDYIGIETGMISKIDVVSSQTHVIHKRDLTWFYKSASDYYGREIYSTVRDILEARFRIEGVDFIVFGNHWPAKKKGGRAFDAVKRFITAQTLRTLVSERLNEDPKIDIVIAGDFNSEPEEVALTNGLNATDDMSMVKESSNCDPILYNLNYEIFNSNKLSREFDSLWNKFVSNYTITGKWDGSVFDILLSRMYDKNKARKDIKDFTVKYHGKFVKAALSRLEKSLKNNLFQRRGTFWFAKFKHWSSIDSIIITKTLFDRTGLSYVKNSYQIVDTDFLKDESGLPYGFAKCVWDDKNNQCMKDQNGMIVMSNGYSDHFPIIAKFRLYN